MNKKKLQIYLNRESAQEIGIQKGNDGWGEQGSYHSWKKAKTTLLNSEILMLIVRSLGLWEIMRCCKAFLRVILDWRNYNHPFKNHLLAISMKLRRGKNCDRCSSFYWGFCCESFGNSSILSNSNDNLHFNSCSWVIKYTESPHNIPSKKVMTLSLLLKMQNIF